MQTDGQIYADGETCRLISWLTDRYTDRKEIHKYIENITDRYTDMQSHSDRDAIPSNLDVRECRSFQGRGCMAVETTAPSVGLATVSDSTVLESSMKTNRTVIHNWLKELYNSTSTEMKWFFYFLTHQRLLGFPDLLNCDQTDQTVPIHYDIRQRFSLNNYRLMLCAEWYRHESIVIRLDEWYSMLA